MSLFLAGIVFSEIIFECVIGNFDLQKCNPEPIEIDFGLSEIPFSKIPFPFKQARYPPLLAQTYRLAKT